MEYRKLGRTGVKVSALCFGTMTFGNEADEPTSAAIVDRFREAGGNFIDTADVFSAGRRRRSPGGPSGAGATTSFSPPRAGCRCRMTLTPEAQDGGT